MENDRINPWRIGLLSVIFYLALKIFFPIPYRPVSNPVPIAQVPMPMNAGQIVEFKPNLTSHGGMVTIIDSKEKSRTFAITASQEKSAQVLCYPRDWFYRRNVDLDFSMWYWRGNKPEWGYMVIHHVS